MKIGKFVGKEILPLTNNEIMLCIHNLQGAKLTYSGDSDIIGRVYSEVIDINIKSSHNYWGTSYKNKPFTAKGKRIHLHIAKKSGVIESDKIFGYVEGSEGTIQYSISLKLYGSLRYKYQRGWMDNVEIFSYYDYDTDLTTLLTNAVTNYNHIKIN